MGDIKFIKFLNSNNGYLINNIGNIYKTNNFGQSWQLIKNIGESITGMHRIDDNTLLVYGKSGKIFLSKNNGSNWKDISINQSNHISSACYSGKILFVSCNNGKIFTTEDLGNTWKQSETFVQNDLNSIYFEDGKTGFAVGNDGTIITTSRPERIDLSQIQLSTKKGDNGKDNHSYEIGNYPNPANPSTIVSFNLDQPSKVNITLYNIAGQKVKEVIDETLKEGLNEIKIDGSSLASGVYFYRVTINNKNVNFTKTNKLLLVK